MLLKIFNKKIVIIVFSSLFILIVGVCVYVAAILNRDSFYEGVMVEGVSLSGMKKEDAVNVLTKNMNGKLVGKKISLKGQNNTWTLEPLDISLKYVVDGAIEKAYNIGREGKIFGRIREIIKLQDNNVNFLCHLTLNKDELKNILSIIKRQTDNKEKSAQLAYVNGEIKKSQETFGSDFDIEKNFSMVEKAILNGQFDGINLEFNEIRPHVTMDDIKGVNGILSVFTTNFNVAAENRSYNIKLACEKINNILLLPGESFSMNKALGPRTLENGYKEAPIILKDEFVQDAGGGVCQVTTTLYCSALLSKLKITDRKPHSLPLGYVPASFDATIAGDYIDLKFENNLDSSILISAQVTGGTVYIRILGDINKKNYQVKLRSEVLEVYEPEVEVIIDNTLPVNEKVVEKQPQRGLKSRLYRDTFDSKGNLLNNELISEDIYKAVNGQVKINEKYKEAEEAKVLNEIN